MSDEKVKSNAQVDQRLTEISSSDTPVADEIIHEVIELLSAVELDPALTNVAIEENEPATESSSAVVEKEIPEDIRQILLKAKLSEKIKLALLGNATCRALLIRDANRMIQQFVLKNPRLQPSEIEDFVKNPNLSEFVIRAINNNSQWMRNYNLKHNLIFNPKTPQDISLKWLKFLNSADIRKLARSKNVPSVISISAKKRMDSEGR